MSGRLTVMSKVVSYMFAVLMVTAATGTNVASAQQEIADRLIGSESFAELELSDDSVVDFAGNAEDPDGEFEDIQGWARLWRDPVRGGGVVAMAAEMDTETSKTFLAGFQSTVPREDRADHPLNPNVVTLEGVNPLDEPTLAAIFSDGTAVFIVIAEGPDQAELLDRAIAAQLALIETPLLEQSADLAEEVGADISGSANNQFIVWTGLVLAIIFAAIWATRRSLKKRFHAAEHE